MNLEQSTRFALAFAREVAQSPKSGLCSTCVDVLGVAEVGITIMVGGQAGPVCSSSASIIALEDMQFTTGEGPCQDAFRSRRLVSAAHMEDGATAALWPSFAELAHASGFGAVFAYPLSTKGARVGVMSLYQRAGGDLTDAQHADSTAMVEILTETVLSLQDAAPSGTLAAGLEDAVVYRAEIHQAAGMVSVQLKVPVSEALLRIRAHAFAAQQPVGRVAADIVTRKLRLSDDRADFGREV